MRLDRALDRFDGDMARRDRSPRSRKDYFLHLRCLFEIEGLPVDPQTSDVTPELIRDCLDKWAGATPSTRYKVDAIWWEGLSACRGLTGTKAAGVNWFFIEDGRSCGYRGTLWGFCLDVRTKVVPPQSRSPTGGGL